MSLPMVEEGVTRMLPTLPPWNERTRSSVVKWETRLGISRVFLSAYQLTAAGWSVRMKSPAWVWLRTSWLMPSG